MSSLQAALLGMAGAAIPEAMRVVALLRTGRYPDLLEWMATLILIALGLGVLLFDTTTDGRLEVAVLGASFPQLFSGLVTSSTPGDKQRRGFRRPRVGNEGFRKVVDYVAWRLN